MATKDTVVQELVVNTLTHKQFKAAQEAGALSPYELYGTPDTSVRLPVLTPMWFDHIAGDPSWLRADTFSWQSGDVYVAAYEHLLEDFEGTISETETIDDITIAFYRAEDGHKICLPDQEANVSALYESTGVAWYYLLDTENKQFKLPRTKWGFTGLRDNVGGYVPESLPNFTAKISGGGSGEFKASGAATVTTSSRQGWGDSSGQNYFNFTISPSITSSTYQDGAPVQQRATQMYLYFYVGNFEQDAVEQTAGINAETFNSKADVDLGNIPANYDYVVESQLPTADNGNTWYRKYKSGWVEQGGIFDTPGKGYQSITLPVEMADTSFSAQVTRAAGTSTSAIDCWVQSPGASLSTTTLVYYVATQTGLCWQVSGMSAQ